MNLVSKILLENENIFQPRKIPEREEEKRKRNEQLIKSLEEITNKLKESFKEYNIDFSSYLQIPYTSRKVLKFLYDVNEPTSRNNVINFLVLLEILNQGEKFDLAIIWSEFSTSKNFIRHLKSAINTSSGSTDGMFNLQRKGLVNRVDKGTYQINSMGKQFIKKHLNIE